MQLLRLTLFTLSLLFVSPLSRAIDIDAYEKGKQLDIDLLKIYLNALGDGLAWANTAILVRDNKPVYCLSPSLPLNADNYIALIDSEIKQNTKLTSNAPLGMVLLGSMKRNFPCK